LHNIELTDANEIEKINFAAESMLLSSRCDVIDIFPAQVPKFSVWYGDVEQYFLRVSFNEYLEKCFRIILKFLCYYTYTAVQSEFPRQVPGTDQFKNACMTYRKITVDDMKSLLSDTVRRNGCFSVYFKEMPLLIVIGSDSFDATVYGLNCSLKILNLFSSLAQSEGLFLREC